MVNGSMVGLLSQDLVVMADVKGKIVYYEIFQSPAHKQPAKVTRYSELKTLHKHIQAEGIDFHGNIPAKTLGHKTSPAFVESRRKGIETFMRECAGSDDVVRSSSWITFLSDADFQVFTSERKASAESNLEAIMSNTHEVTPQKGIRDVSGCCEYYELDVEELSDDLEGSVYDKIRTQLSVKQKALADAEADMTELTQSMKQGHAAQQQADHDTEMAVAHARDALVKLGAHRLSLQHLADDLKDGRVHNSEVETRKLEEVKSLEETLKAAAATTRTAKQKFEASRSARTKAEAESKHLVWEVENRVHTCSVEHAAALEHIASMNGALVVMEERLRSTEVEARKLEIEYDVAALARKTVQEEVDAATEDVQQSANTSMHTQAILARHKETSARRARAFQAELRRAAQCAEHASALRNQSSRNQISSEDAHIFEHAESCAVKGAESAEKVLKHAKEKAALSLQSDKNKDEELARADALSCASLNRHEIVLQELKGRLEDVDAKFKAATKKRACANAARKVARDDLTSLKARVEGELTEATDSAAGNLREAQAEADRMREQAAKDMLPLAHQEEADLLVLRQGEQAEASLVQLLDEARTLACEAKAEQYEPKKEDLEEISRGDSRSLLIESTKARVSDSQKELDAAQREASESASALSTAEAELMEKVQGLEREKAVFKAEIEQLLCEEGDDLSQEEIANLASSEEDSPVLQGLKQEVAVMQAVIGDLRQTAEEKQAAWVVATSAIESAEAELAQLEEEERNSALPPMTWLFLQQELELIHQQIRKYEDEQNDLLKAQTARQENWETEAGKLQEKLLQASMCVEVAKADLHAAQSIRKSLHN